MTLPQIIEKLEYHVSHLACRYPSDSDVGAIGACVIVELKNLLANPNNKDTVPLKHYASLCTMITRKNNELQSLRNQQSKPPHQ